MNDPDKIAGVTGEVADYESIDKNIESLKVAIENATPDLCVALMDSLTLLEGSKEILQKQVKMLVIFHHQRQ